MLYTIVENIISIHNLCTCIHSYNVRKIYRCAGEKGGGGVTGITCMIFLYKLSTYLYVFLRNTFVIGKTFQTFCFLAKSASLLTPKTADDMDDSTYIPEGGNYDTEGDQTVEFVVKICFKLF